MALDSLIRNGVALASKTFKPLKVSVKRYAWVRSADGFGSPDFSSPYDEPDTLKAIVEVKEQQRQLNDGRLVMTIAHITILDPMADKVVAEGVERINPVDPRDKFVLADGTTGPVVDVAGPPNDPKTDRPYFVEVWLGSGSMLP